jgi:MOSC domain-containing protein YiiM
MTGIVIAVSRSPRHTMAKANEASIRLLAGLGVEGDAHQGKTVKHRSRVARNPADPNLRQVHLIHAELHNELRQRGFHVEPGQMGENITTWGVDLLGLATGTRLYIGDSAIIEVTGLRNPCAQLDKIQKGLMAATLDRDAAGNLVRKAGIMGIVLAAGEVPPVPYRLQSTTEIPVSCHPRFLPDPVTSAFTAAFGAGRRLPGNRSRRSKNR